jgi:hypothetical protein
MLIEFQLPTVDVRHLNVLVRALCALDVLYLRANPRTPLIKQSGVRYQTQPHGCERFRTIPDILRQGNGDCDQLAPWRAAELRVREGIKAMPEVRRMGKNLWHVYVRLPDGSVEDISAHLGMPIPPRLAALGREILRKKHGHASSFYPARSAAVGGGVIRLASG